MGHRVMPTDVPGMAAADSLQGEPAAAQRTKAGDRLFGVAGTAGVKTTVGTEQRTDAVAVKPDQAQDHCLHVSDRVPVTNAGASRASAIAAPQTDDAALTGVPEREPAPARQCHGCPAHVVAA